MFSRLSDVKLLDRIKAVVARKIWHRPQLAPLLRFLGWISLRVEETSRRDSGYEVVDTSDQWVAAGLPEWNSTDEAQVVRVTRELGVWRVARGSVFLNTKFPAVLRGSDLLVHPRFEKGPYDYNPTQSFESTSGIYLQSEDSVLVKRKENQISHPKAVYCGTRAPHNWGHWLLNFLPGVMIAADYFSQGDAPPLIVPEGYKKTESRAALFDLFWGSRDVIVVDSSRRIEIDELIWFEQPVADSPRSSDPQNLELKAVHLSSMTRFRERILRSISRKCSDPISSNVFLAREVGRRDYNQAVVHEQAEDLGYRVVYLDRLPVREQIRVIHAAKRIVGPIGSAFASLLFANEEAKAITFARREHQVDNTWWSSFAHVAGVELSAHYIEGRGTSPWALDSKNVFDVMREFAV